VSPPPMRLIDTDRAATRSVQKRAARAYHPRGSSTRRILSRSGLRAGTERLSQAPTWQDGRFVPRPRRQPPPHHGPLNMVVAGGKSPQRAIPLHTNGHGPRQAHSPPRASAWLPAGRCIRARVHRQSPFRCPARPRRRQGSSLRLRTPTRGARGLSAHSVEPGLGT